MNKKLTPAEQWEQATFANNFIFYKVLSTNPDLCKEIIELLLEIEIDHVEIIQEDSIIIDYDSKGIRLDVYLKTDNKVFDLEIQKTDTRDLPKRARYYQGIMDVDQLKTGNRYDALKDSYVIFICLEDIFKKGFPVYKFQNYCEQDKNLCMNDGAIKYWFIPKNYDKLTNKSQQDFLNFITTNIGKTNLTSKLRAQVQLAKTNTQWRHQFMEWRFQIEEERYQARKEGLAEGREEGLAEGRKKGLAEGRTEGLAEGLAEGKIQGCKENALKNAVLAVTKLNSSPEIVSKLFDVNFQELNEELKKIKYVDSNHTNT